MADHNLYAELRGAKKILLIHVGGLGDTIHQFPAAYALHQALPGCEIHFAMGGGEGLFQLTPWIHKHWHAPAHFNLKNFDAVVSFVRAIRREKFDCTILFWPRNSLIGMLALSGAKLRVSRSPQTDKPAWLTRAVAHRVLEHSWFNEPWFTENCAVLKKYGIPVADDADFGASIPPSAWEASGLTPAQRGQYIHVSPFATDDRRGLPDPQLSELLNGLHQKLRRPMVISISNDERQQRKLRELLPTLKFAPMKVFAGSLNFAQFAAVVSGAAVHVGPDSGGIHVAMMVRTPIMTWFRRSINLPHFAPTGPDHRVFVSDNPAEDAAHDLDVQAMIEATREVIRALPASTSGA